jgi:hypothetical protein
VRTAPGAPGADGVAVISGNTPTCTQPQTATWSATEIPLFVGSENTRNTIVVTVTDIAGNSADSTILIERQVNVTTVAEDDSDKGIVYEAQPVDQDGDGVADSADNCPNKHNPVGDWTDYNGEAHTDQQPDFDLDLLGDACDDDDDQDGLRDTWEIKYELNPRNSNSDGDGPADGAENPDGDAYDNKTEHDKDTNPLVKNGFDMVIRDLSGQSDISDSWLPVYNTAVMIQAIWKGGGAPASAIFELESTSTNPGRAVNDPHPDLMQTPGYPLWYYDKDQQIDNYHGPDFGLTAINPTTDSNLHSFEQQGPIGGVTGVVSGADTIYTIYLQCWDYGGRTKVKVSAGDFNEIGELWVPKGTSTEQYIAAAWDHDNNPSTDRSFSPQEALDDKDKILTHVYDDETKNIQDPPKATSEGDDFTVFEEFRGIVFTQGGVLKHLRLNPDRPDLFVRAVGLDDAQGDVYTPLPADVPDNWYPFKMGMAYKNCGIDVHNTTGWGHDGTEDGSFFIYFKKGAISQVSSQLVVGAGNDWLGSWPENEWEFKLDSGSPDAWTPVKQWLPGDGTDSNPPRLVLDYAYNTTIPSGSSEPYAIRLPVPPINVLLVRFDTVTAKLRPNDDPEGYIVYQGVAPPVPWGVVDTGSRNWSWSTKGYSRWDRDDFQYGAAIAMQIPLDHYFGDKSYQKGTVWNEATLSWDPAPTDPEDERMKLMPLSQSEDPLDTGQFASIEVEIKQGVWEIVYIYDGVVPGDDNPNKEWDGDKRLLEHAEWDDPQTGQLSPFDIDNDGIVECPAVDLVADANDNEQDDLGNKYTKPWVLKHSISHEIGHGIGGLIHSDFAWCLMSKYSDDWKRDHFLSNQFRSRLKIHNKIRELPNEVF